MSCNVSRSCQDRRAVDVLYLRPAGGCPIPPTVIYSYFIHTSYCNTDAFETSEKSCVQLFMLDRAFFRLGTPS